MCREPNLLGLFLYLQLFAKGNTPGRNSATPVVCLRNLRLQANDFVDNAARIVSHCKSISLFYKCESNVVEK